MGRCTIYIMIYTAVNSLLQIKSSLSFLKKIQPFLITYKKTVKHSNPYLERKKIQLSVMLGCYSNIIHLVVVSLQDLALHCAKHIRKTELTKQNKCLYHSSTAPYFSRILLALPLFFLRYWPTHDFTPQDTKNSHTVIKLSQQYSNTNPQDLFSAKNSNLCWFQCLLTWFPQWP